LFEQAQADPGTRPAPQQNRIIGMIRGHTFETPHGVATASASWVPEPKPAWAGMASCTVKTIGGGQIEGAAEKTR